jgi:hypothetical protein
MILIVLGLAFVVVIVRWRMGHRHRRSVELGANVAAMQPLTEWSARHGRYPKGMNQRGFR